MRDAKQAEIERLRELLEPCRLDTDPQTDSGYPKTVNDYLSLLGAYIADVMPDDAVPDDEYFGAWERLARPVIERLVSKEAEAETLRRERAGAVQVARSICRDRDYDNSWPDNLHMADIIEKRLCRLLYGELAELKFTPCKHCEENRPLRDTLRNWAYTSLVIGTHRSCDCVACDDLRQTVIDMEVSDG